MALMAAMAVPAAAADMVLGVGRTAYNFTPARDSAILGLELHGAPRWRVGRVDLALAAVVEAHRAGDRFVGLGLAAMRDLRGGWFLEASAMPGHYHASRPENGLGSNFQIRTVFGIGRRLEGGAALSLAFTHKSNAGTGRVNPGMNGLLLRWRKAL